MRAYQLPKGGAGIDALTKVDRPQPKPGHRQVLVKVAACSLNFRDLGIVRGTYRIAGARQHRAAVGRRGRGGRGRLRRQAREGGRQGRRLLLPALAGRRCRARCARHRARRRHRRHARGIRRAGGRGRRENPGASVGGGGRDAAVRRGHRLARDDGARQADRRADGAAARHRRRFGVRACSSRTRWACSR